jgi:ubiquinone/menaquinone biosynthesis C-methylase UbiE
LFISVNVKRHGDGAGCFKKNLIEHYDIDAADYYKRNYLDETSYSPQWFRQHYIERMVESVGLYRASKILDAGCGPGGLVLSLLRKGYRVWGVDISSRMIDEATEFVRRNGFPDFDQLTVGDIEVLDFDQDFFDVVVASGVIEYQKTDTIALSEMNRVLANGGHLIVNVTNRYSCNHLLRPVYQPLKRIPLAAVCLALSSEMYCARVNWERYPQRELIGRVASIGFSMLTDLKRCATIIFISHQFPLHWTRWCGQCAYELEEVWSGCRVQLLAASAVVTWSWQKKCVRSVEVTMRRL